MMALENHNFIDSLPWFISIPLGFVATKYIGLSNKQAKSDVRLATLEKTCADLCKQSQEQTKLLHKISGQLEEHLRISTPR